MNVSRRLFCAASALFLAGCSTVGHVRHEYVMRGQVLLVEGLNVYLCVGRSDGAQVGQELQVERIKVVPAPRNPQIKRSSVGRVRVSWLLEDHYARAEILSGDVQVNDVVELR